MNFDLTQAISLVSTIGTVMAAFLIYFQIKSFEAWNRKQTSHEILNDFVSGSIEDTLETLESKFGWDVLHDNQTYQEIAGKTQNLTELDQLLRRLLRRFEAICISMDHKIVQESTCREYIFSLLVTIYRGMADWSEPGAMSQRFSSFSKSMRGSGRAQLASCAARWA
jgi:hypothetical protein